ncbi:MAG: response regulator [Fibrobacteria bacterium]|nr:response regulator [Fibrobacteria bacterium]
MANINPNKVEHLLNEIEAAKKDFSIRVGVPGEDKTIAGLALAVNGLLESFEKEIRRKLEYSDLANRARTEFYNNISHEIRTPLNAIQGFSELLSSSSLNNQQENYISIIKENGELLGSLITDTLDVSKVDCQDDTSPDIDFDLENLLEGILKIFRPRLKGKNVDLYLDFEEDAPKDFRGNPTRLRQIFLNLVSNSIRLTDKGEVSIYVGLEERSEKKRTLRISVKNTGIIISDQTVKPTYSGTELGLFFTRSLVKKMGGKFSVLSRGSMGSEFILLLDLQETTPVSHTNVTPLSLRELEGKNILLIDYNDYSTEIITSYCNELNMNILHKTSEGKNALEWLFSQSQVPDLVLADIIMPDMDGYEFAKMIRKRDIYKKIKLITVTSEAQPGTAQKAKNSGYDGYLPKPFTKREIFNVIQTTLGDNRPEGQIVTRHLSEELYFKGLKVLLAEDNPINQKLVYKMLDRLGCEIEMVKQGDEAFEKVEANLYDVCLMDVNMPVMNGPEATKKIRQLSPNLPNRNIPIIAMMAVEEGDQQECRASGMNDILLKPIDLPQLKEVIYNWVNRE